jgi:hypothetical protein
MLLEAENKDIPAYLIWISHICSLVDVRGRVRICMIDDEKRQFQRVVYAKL